MTDHFCPIDHIAIDAVDFDTALAFFKKEFRPPPAFGWTAACSCAG